MEQYFVSFPGLNIEQLPISRVAFEVFGYPIYMYGLIISLGVLLCLTFASISAKRYQFSANDVFDYFLVMMPFSVIGARAYYVAFEWQQYAGDWVSIFDLRKGGLGFYGGVIGGVLAIFVVSIFKRQNPVRFLDFIIVYIPLAQAIGRWGNFFNQEAFGTNTKLPWGMISNGTVAYLQKANIPGVDPYSPVHPTFFYEFSGNMLIFFFLLYTRHKRRTIGRNVAWYLLLYGILRFFVEGLRTDSLMLTDSLRVSQVLSLGFVVFGCVYLIFTGIFERFFKSDEPRTKKAKVKPQVETLDVEKLVSEERIQKSLKEMEAVLADKDNETPINPTNVYDDFTDSLVQEETKVLLTGEEKVKSQVEVELDDTDTKKFEKPNAQVRIVRASESDEV